MGRRTIRTAVLGYGRNGSTMHAGGIANNPEFEMVAVCDVDERRRKQAAERFACAVYDDYRRMLTAEDLDLVCIVTRSDQHCQMTCDCLDAGVSVLVTKPWAVNRAEALRMVRRGQNSRGRLLPWLPVRWACDFRRLRELLAAGAVGDVFMIRRCCSSFGSRNDWQTETRYGGGYVLNWGPHIVDPAVLLGGSGVRSVYGQTRKAINPGDAEDLFTALITLDSGMLVLAEYTVGVNHLPNWFIQGTRGTIIVHGSKLALHRHTPSMPNDPTRYTAMTTAQDDVVEEALSGNIYGDTDEIYRVIADAMLDRSPYPVTPEDAFTLSVTLDAIKESQAANAVVTPDYRLD